MAMRFLGKNAKGETIPLPVRVHKDSDYKEVYAHGAFGGPMANYHFRIDFYQDSFPPLEYISNGAEIEPSSLTEIERRVVTSVHMPLPFLKELRNWLDKHVGLIEEEYGEIKLPTGDDEAKLSETEPIQQIKEA